MMTWSRNGWRRSLLFLLLAPLIGPARVDPATIVVDGGCSLSDAIIAANTDGAVGECSAGAGADEIILTADVPLAEALPDIANTSSITIRGNGFMIRRRRQAPDFRLFYVSTNGDLTIDNTVVVGGAAYSGAGIFNRGDLTVHNSWITGNIASGIGGGGISSQGNLTLTNSTVSDNSAVFGGGIESSGPTVIVDSHLLENHAESRGGAIHHYGTSLSIRGSTLSGNTVTGGSGAPGHYAGGGLFTYWGGPVSLINSTVSGNSIGAGNGGGIFNYYDDSLTLTNTTVAQNSAPSGSAIYQYIATTTLVNSVVSGSCSSTYPFIDGGNNFGCGFNELKGLEPLLADHGGPTPTHALEAGSSAIDAAGTCPEVADQRGFGRNGDCDSGAFEFEGVRPPIGGAVSGLDTFRALCRNRTTGSRIPIVLAGDAAWNCEDSGLVAVQGDTVEQVILGEALADLEAIEGSVVGMRLEGVRCSNMTTGQRIVTVPAGLATDWRCSTAGLEHTTGDRIRVIARGSAD